MQEEDKAQSSCARRRLSQCYCEAAGRAAGAMRRSGLCAILVLCLSVQAAAFPPCTQIDGDPDCYTVLGVKPAAKLKDIKKGVFLLQPPVPSASTALTCPMLVFIAAYRTKARDVHPDKVKRDQQLEDANAAFVALAAACAATIQPFRHVATLLSPPAERALRLSAFLASLASEFTLRLQTPTAMRSCQTSRRAATTTAASAASGCAGAPPFPSLRRAAPHRRLILTSHSAASNHCSLPAGRQVPRRHRGDHLPQRHVGSLAVRRCRRSHPHRRAANSSSGPGTAPRTADPRERSCNPPRAQSRAGSSSPSSAAPSTACPPPPRRPGSPPVRFLSRCASPFSSPPFISPPDSALCANTRPWK